MRRATRADMRAALLHVRDELARQHHDRGWEVSGLIERINLALPEKDRGCLRTLTDGERVALLEAERSAHTDWAAEMIAENAKLKGRLHELERHNQHAIEAAVRRALTTPLK